jgi:hypothetical protein
MGREAGQLLLELARGRGHVGGLGPDRARLRRQAEHAEAEAADRREVGGLRRRRAVVGEMRRAVAGPELVELGAGQERGGDGLHLGVGDEHGLA